MFFKYSWTDASAIYWLLTMGYRPFIQSRDRYEQECLKIKGYIAQGHMVMGQEERRNKAKLEKAQISVATSNTDYKHSVKALEDTTARWIREWKLAADKF